MTKYISIAFITANRQHIESPAIGSTLDAINRLQEQLAAQIAVHYDIRSNGRIEHEGDMTDIGYMPNRPGQECPMLLDRADPSGEFGDDEQPG